MFADAVTIVITIADCDCILKQNPSSRHFLFIYPRECLGNIHSHYRRKRGKNSSNQARPLAVQTPNPISNDLPN